MNLGLSSKSWRERHALGCHSGWWRWVKWQRCKILHHAQNRYGLAKGHHEAYNVPKIPKEPMLAYIVWRIMNEDVNRQS